MVSYYLSKKKSRHLGFPAQSEINFFDCYNKTSLLPSFITEQESDAIIFGGPM